MSKMTIVERYQDSILETFYNQTDTPMESSFYESAKVPTKLWKKYRKHIVAARRLEQEMDDLFDEEAGL